MAKNDDENVVILEEADFDQDEETESLDEQEDGDSDGLVSLDELEPVAFEQPADAQEEAKKARKSFLSSVGLVRASSSWP